MATQKSVPRSKNQSAHLSRKTRVAHAAGEEILAHLREDPVLRVLAEQQTLKDDVAALKQAVGVLATAPQKRIGAARRLQGAASRRQTAAQQLFAACGEIRRRVKIRFRGPRHQELRQGFGEGLAANASKPETVLCFADQILQSAAQHPDALREVRILPSTIRREIGRAHV